MSIERTSSVTPGADLVALVHEWTARRRAGARYQPADGPGADDPNGCIPKRDLLIEAGCRLNGARVLSLGCNAAYYERALIDDALAYQPAASLSSRNDAPLALGDPTLASIDLVDTDPTALDAAANALATRASVAPRITAGPAEKFVIDGEYDICLFLSLYHHYDRLGPSGRAIAIRMLRDVGAHCQTMFFETGQSDDTVAGAEVWRATLEMSRESSPRAWLERAVPAYSGYDAWHCLGRNPRTNRLLYAFWHDRAAPNPQLLRGRGTLFDCTFTRRGTSAAVCESAAVRISGTLAESPRDTYAVLVHLPEALRYFPRSIPVVVSVSARTESGVLRAVNAARFAGARAVSIRQAEITPRVRERVSALGATLVSA